MQREPRRFGPAAAESRFIAFRKRIRPGWPALRQSPSAPPALEFASKGRVPFVRPIRPSKPLIFPRPPPGPLRRWGRRQRRFCQRVSDGPAADIGNATRYYGGVTTSVQEFSRYWLQPKDELPCSLFNNARRIVGLIELVERKEAGEIRPQPFSQLCPPCSVHHSVFLRIDRLTSAMVIV